MKNLILIILTVITFQGCVTRKENMTPTIPKPPVVFSSIDK